MLGVPLVVGRQVLGVLHVGSLTRRRFGPSDVHTLEMVGHRVAGAIQANQLRSERAAARVLQRSLLPPALPDSPRFRLASRYVPAERGGVGGDWYDAFWLPSGELWLTAGDVGGHGLRAAVVMGRLRSTIRSYALEGWAPDKVLALTDRKLQHFEEGATATVVSAVFPPSLDSFRLASAGHPPPVLATPGQPARLLSGTPAPLLGAVPGLQPDFHELDFPRFGVLVLYTDGLIERRGQDLTLGLERLRRAVRAEEPELVCRQVMARLVGAWAGEDDIALLAIQRQAP
jgi:serine phosphatase RsbU (regulator of sigma subunit)